MDFQASGEQASVMMKFTQSYPYKTGQNHIIPCLFHVYPIYVGISCVISLFFMNLTSNGISSRYPGGARRARSTSGSKPIPLARDLRPEPLLNDGKKKAGHQMRIGS